MGLSKTGADTYSCLKVNQLPGHIEREEPSREKSLDTHAVILTQCKSSVKQQIITLQAKQSSVTM